jgi:MFS family permease
MGMALDRFGPRPCLLLGVAITVFGTIMFATAQTSELLVLARAVPFALIAWLAVFGLVSAYGPVVVAHGKMLFPPHRVGRGLTALNMAAMGGVFLSQPASGCLIEMFPPAPSGAYPLDAYQRVFGLQGAAILAACVAYLRARDFSAERPSPAPNA